MLQLTFIQKSYNRRERGMLFRKTQVIFNNGLTLDCQKICFRTDEYVVVFTNNDTYEVYNKFGENISPEGCTHIEKGIKNQLIIRFETKESSISQVYYFQNGVLHPITFYRPSTPDIPLVCNFIFVIGGWERKKAFFRYVLCIYNKNGEEVIGLGTEDGGEVWLDLIYTDFQVTEAGFIVINSENMFGVV